MSDPLPTDSSPQGSQGGPASEALPGVGRDAKIEQLLLTGLDHYFDGQYDQSIHIWTRALFLDRGHARARAYIERARGALAEQQRESEELLQRGLAAFDRGSSAEARRLLEAAITRGAPRDEALSVLDRIQRLDQPVGVTQASSSEPLIDGVPTPTSRQPTQPSSRGRMLLAWAGMALGVLVLGLIASGVLSIQVRWGQPQPMPGGVPVAQADDALPLPRRGELALSRARLLAPAGRLRDALASLDQIALTDEERAAADRLRADIQRHLIATGSAAPTAPAVLDPEPSVGSTP
ncbi:MAG: hypothetical protein FJW27_00695 [Acidimicrobiia bacterium]|nr:hypothetical protein [Acidimicrobiia bacterium]